MTITAEQETVLKRLYTDNYGKSIAHFTHKNLQDILSNQGDREYEVPTFDPDKIKNIPQAQAQGIEFWDSWAVLNHQGQLANFNGFHLVVAMGGSITDASQGYLYLFSQPVDSTKFDDYNLIGRLFTDDAHKQVNDYYVEKQTQEWSGSTILEDDGSLRLFYAAFSGDKSKGGSGDSDQTLITANIPLSFDGTNITIGQPTDWRSLFDGDSSTYQSESQFDVLKWANEDNHALRDGHYFEDNGKKYLLFEANTGKNYGYQGAVEFYNTSNLGGNLDFDVEKVLEINNDNELTTTAQVANGALGLIQLTDDYKVAKILPPLLVATTVTDEIERPNLIKYNNMYYIFTVTRGAKMANKQVSSRDIYMLGYYSPDLNTQFKPLNGNGLVLHQNADPDAIDFTYSYLIMPNESDTGEFVVTSYATNRNRTDGHNATFANSFTLKLDKGTSEVTGKILNQGQLTL